MEAPTPPGRDGLGDLIGLEYLDMGPEEVRARLEVTDEVRQPVGLVHGGVFASMAESMCSAATWFAVKDGGMAAMGQSNSATFIRPITEGHVRATARPRHRGRTTWVWDVEITDDEERLCALVRMTVAVRPVRPG
ncbi:MAG: PaaI family thioesterase [Solirubrobacterales bacterium]